MKLMMNKWIFIYCVQVQCLLAAGHLCRIDGVVSHAETRGPLAHVNVQIVNTSLGCAADENGYYSITHIPPGKYTLRISHIAFQTKEIHGITLAPGEDKRIDFILEPSVLYLDSLRVEADPFSEKYPTEVSKINIQRIESKRLRSIPGTLDDVMRSVHIFSNVVPASDYTSFFSVRGGSPAENVVIFDGVEIPNPYRFRIAMGGGMSIFDPKLVENVNVHVGGFPAEYGNFLSSVMEIDIREGNRQKRYWGAALNIMDVSAFGEGPFLNQRGSYLFSARRTFFDLVADRFTNTNATYPYTTDFDIKLNYQLTSTEQIQLHYLHANEKTHVTSDLTSQINLNEVSQIDLVIFKYQRRWLENLKQISTYSWYSESFKFDTWNPIREYDDDFYARLDSKIDKISVDQQLKYQPGQHIWLTSGYQMQFSDSKLDYVIHENNYAFTRKTMPPQTDHQIKETFSIGYVNLDFSFLKNFQTRLGLRYDHSRWIKKGAFSPRFNMLYNVSVLTSLYASYARCYQYPQVYDTFNRDVPFAYVRSIDIRPEEADHFNIGLEHVLEDHLSVRIEAYYRNMNALLFPINNTDFVPKNTGRGRSQGASITITRKPQAGSWHGTAMYAFGHSEYQSSKDALWHPTLYDRRHNFSIYLQKVLADNFQISLLWRAASGLPYYPVIGVLDSEDGSLREFFKEDEHFERYPSYQRLDIRLNYVHQTVRMKLQFYMELINLYNHHNVHDQVWQMLLPSLETEEIRDIHMRTVYMFPFLPSIGVRVDF